jgi:NAD(P)-dependent dehydrogenase (short-subunit alcohol dehydrogenase family)
MGYQAARRLRDLGHTVLGVDVREGEVGINVSADLSTPDGRRRAADEVLSLSDGMLDGAVLAAGLGPGPGADRPRLIAEVNFFGVVDLLEAWRPALAAADRAKVVVLSSNSTTTVPAVPRRAIRALLAGDTDKAVRSLRLLGRNGTPIMYAASKIAVSRWVRRHAVRAAWAGAGIRLNALAPGAIMTPLLQSQLSEPLEGRAVRAFPVPIGGFGDAGHLADWICFMLSDSADFLCGSIVFVDGGSDAYFRTDAWPRAVPIRGLAQYVWRFKRGVPR